MLKSTIDQVVFTEFIDNGEYHFAADWEEQNARYTSTLHKQVRKELKARAKAKFGYHNGITGSSVFVYI